MKIKIVTKDGLDFIKSEKGFIDFLRIDKDFERYVREARMLVGIPTNIDETNEKINLHADKVKLIENIALNISNIYSDLPEHWYTIFAGIIMTGTARPSEYKESEEITCDFEDESPFDEPYRKNVTITIHTRVSKRKIKKFIDDSKKLNQLLQ